MPEFDKSVLKGTFDIHVHTGPEAHKVRKFDEYELAAEALKWGAKGMIIKTHSFETASRAQLVRKQFPDLAIYGGIALNEATGGLNPAAVSGVASLGGKIVWLPTFDSDHERAVHGKTGGIVCVKYGRVVPVLEQIMEIIAASGMVLATGHLRWQDQMIVVARAHELGVKRILVNHPTLWRIHMPVEAQRELMKYGVYFERNYGGSRLPDDPAFEKHFERNLAEIKELGAETSIMATDLGQPNNAGWSDGFAEYIWYMRDHGVSEADVKLMTRTNPARLFGLE